jgi:hypothetical protein
MKNTLLALLSIAIATALHAAPDAPRDLVLHLPMDGKVVDVSPTHAPCEPRGTEPATDRHGRRHGAVRFPGNAMVNVGKVGAFNGMKEFTLAAWVCPEIRREHLNIFSKVTPYRDFNLQIDALGRPVSHIMANGYEFCYAKTPIPMNEWTQITATYRNNTWSMYLNGRRDSEVQVRNPPRWVSEHFTIGALEIYGSEHFQGRMDDLRVYARALSAEEVRKLAAR